MSGKKLYEQFVKEVHPTRLQLGWSELPRHVQEAWENVYKTARVSDDYDQNEGICDTERN